MVERPPTKAPSPLASAAEILAGARVAFVADQFADAPRTPDEPYPGGAELTDAAALEAAPIPVTCLRTAELRPEEVADFDLLILGNLEAASPRLLEALAAHGRHVLFEHDLRLCRWRGNFPSAHDAMHRRGATCTCPNPAVHTLFASALGAIFLTENQRRHYAKNPYYQGAPHAILGSSLMNRAFFERLDRRADPTRQDEPPREHRATICYSGSASKGFQEALELCRTHAIEPFIIRHLRPPQVLDVLAHSQSFIYLPQAFEAAGRMPLEARFLGARVITNRVTGIAGEPWWQLDDAAALAHVRQAPARFWQHVARFYVRPAPARRKAPRAAEFTLYKGALKPLATALSLGRAALEKSPLYPKLGQASQTLNHAIDRHQAALSPLEPLEL
ncbi:hypothetical protein DL240_06030 [Lujinxingia litoralis]|uniref:Glycosyltransferase n=1 Tax=Lujinxingia litoralis TaxID=2211119 RepID=A0A328C784_9DELT|nr:hypothetical protein [Lujinxingia litoralis]RAL23713.1 hypothetical protein DL240_06030 [Lujinxingia litoralis]